jgi:hypothetical protein
LQTEVAPETAVAETAGSSSVAVRRALTVGGLGAAAVAIGASRAAAAEKDTLNLVANIEYAAVTVITAAAGFPFVKAVKNPVVQAFLTTTLAQHTAALAALEKAGAAKQTEVTPAVSAGLGLDGAGKLKDILGVVGFAKVLEDKLIQTAIANTTVDVKPANRQLLAQLAVSAAQRLAILRAVEALLEGNAADLIALPPNAAKLPEAAGGIGFPVAFVKTNEAIKAG